MNHKEKAEDICINISEELKMFMNFEVEIFKDKHSWKMRMDTVSGIYIFTPDLNQNLMFNVYRFISNYGLRLHGWGLVNKISENSVNFQTQKNKTTQIGWNDFGVKSPVGINPKLL